MVPIDMAGFSRSCRIPVLTGNNASTFENKAPISALFRMLSLRMGVKNTFTNQSISQSGRLWQAARMRENERVRLYVDNDAKVVDVVAFRVDELLDDLLALGRVLDSCALDERELARGLLVGEEQR